MSIESTEEKVTGVTRNMSLNAIKSRLGAIGPTQLSTLGKGARRLLEEDLPKLIAIASYAQSLFAEDGAFESISHLLAAFRLKDSLDALTPLHISTEESHK